MKQKILSLTAKNFRWEFIRGSGKGGQKRNKTCSAVRCTHEESGATAWCENGRSQVHNRREAFLKCVNSEKFQNWLRIQTSREMRDREEIINKLVEEQMQDKYLSIEYFNHDDNRRNQNE